MGLILVDSILELGSLGLGAGLTLGGAWTVITNLDFHDPPWLVMGLVETAAGAYILYSRAPASVRAADPLAKLARSVIR